jgi:tetratricopeptide (TPR) repeat protein
MPHTINGIGTMYYGNKNASVRTGACEFCRRVVTLQSYDTRLWFVIVFIPVIPLGRKRIFDQCPACTKHRAMSARDYEDIKSQQVAQSLDRFAGDPSPQSALAAHATILSFRELERAAQLRKDALSRFPRHVDMLAGMASHLEEVSSLDESAKLYEAALELQPDLPRARTGVAMRRMAEGKLDEARSLLDFLELSGAGREHSLQPLNVLAAYFQKQGRHVEALEIAGHLLREQPSIGQQHDFRAFVRKSEKARGPGESILPARKHSVMGLFSGGSNRYASWQRWLIFGGGSLAIILGGLGITNEYIRRHRTIYVVNACGQPVQVQIDDRTPESIADFGSLITSEGHHRVKMSGPVTETQEVDLETGYFERWMSKPVWVLNPGREAVLEEATVYYAEHPRPSQGRLIVGQPFVFRAHIDYPFELPPTTLKLKSKSEELAKTIMRWLHADDIRAFTTALDENAEVALAFAESRLRRHPDDNSLLKTYLRNVVKSDQPRVTELLKAELGRRPVVVPWHRAYQVMSELDPHGGTLALYDGFLNADPTNGSLLYLRGRIERDWDRQEVLYRQSIKADPRLPWPWLALGLRAQAGALWDESLKDLLKARELEIDDEDVSSELQTARLATGQAKTMVHEYRAKLASAPFDLSTIVFLCEALAAAGEPEKIAPELSAWEKLVRNSTPPAIIAQIRALALYYAGKLAECEEYCRRNPGLESSLIRAQSLLALSRSRDVASDRAFDAALEDPWLDLAVSLGLSVEKNPNDAARWRELAIQRLNSSSSELRQVAKALGAAAPATDHDLSRILISAELKALVLAVLAERFPAKRAEFLAAAARFNVRRRAPYQLVRRAIERAAKPR